MNRTIILVAFCLASAGCRASLPLPEDPGRIDGWVYRQDYFGLSWRLPEEASVHGRGWVKKTLKEEASALAEGPLRSALEQGLSRTASLVTLILEPTRPGQDDATMILAAAERLPEAYGVRDGTDYLRLSSQVMRASGAPMRALRPAYRETIGGVPFDAQDFEITIATPPAPVMGNTLFAAVRKNYALLFSIAYAGEEGLRRARSVLGQASLARGGWSVDQAAPSTCAGKGCGKPADEGDLDPDVALAYRSQHGQGMAQDLGRAAKLYRRAADRGNGSAQARLAAMYMLGLGVSEDRAKAHEWFRKAAEQGSANSQVQVALAYINGGTVPKDLVEAHAWLSLAASQGNEPAASRLRSLSASMTPDQLSRAGERAKRIKMPRVKAAEGSP